jgi:hypothetical protein
MAFGDDDVRWNHVTWIFLPMYRLFSPSANAASTTCCFNRTSKVSLNILQCPPMPSVRNLTVLGDTVLTLNQWAGEKLHPSSRVIVLNDGDSIQFLPSPSRSSASPHHPSPLDSPFRSPLLLRQPRHRPSQLRYDSGSPVADPLHHSQLYFH